MSSSFRQRSARALTVLFTYILAGSLVGMLAGAALFRAEAKGPVKHQPAHAAAAAACKKDADCVLVPDDCCSCTQGGKQRAILAARQDAYEKERNKRCGGTMCVEVMSRDPSCSSVAACRAGACVLAVPSHDSAP